MSSYISAKEDKRVGSGGRAHGGSKKKIPCWTQSFLQKILIKQV